MSKKPLKMEAPMAFFFCNKENTGTRILFLLSTLLKVYKRFSSSTCTQHSNEGRFHILRHMITFFYISMINMYMICSGDELIE